MEKSIQLGNNYDPMSVEAPTVAGHVYLYRDGVVPFLRLKVTPRWRVWQFDSVKDGKHVKRKIGDAILIGLTDARLRAYDWARQLSEGKEPPTVEDRRRAILMGKITIGECFEQYKKQHLARGVRTKDDIEWGYGKYWGALKNLPLADLTSDIVQLWVNELASNSGDATATKQFGTLKACLRFAQVRKLIAKLPEGCLMGIKTYKSPPKLSYLKQGDELIRLTAALQTESKEVHDAVLLLLWTGQRKSNVLAMEWAELDLNRAMWLIPPSKTKTNRQYAVALTPKALEVIQSRKSELFQDDRYVFPCVRDCTTRHLKHLNKAWLRIRKKANLGDLRLHDLRHTAATWLAMSGASAMVIQQMMHHSSVMTSQKYVHLAPSVVRDFMTLSQEAQG